MSHGTQGSLGLLLAVGVLRLALVLLDDDECSSRAASKHIHARRHWRRWSGCCSRATPAAGSATAALRTAGCVSNSLDVALDINEW